MSVYCKKCNTYKDEDKFTRSELERKTPRCKKCILANNRLDYLSRISTYKKLGQRTISCTVCGAEMLALSLKKKFCGECARKRNNECVNNSTATKEYRKKNKNRLNEVRNLNRREKRKTDPSFKLRENISRSIKEILKGKGSSKGGKSFLNSIDYSMNCLKSHLELQFEFWMNWSNHGNYDPNIWDDNDSTTWTWQLDHIIPHSMFVYTTMDCQEFRDCWALSNLRPLSAKQNVLDGTRRTRHKKVK